MLFALLFVVLAVSMFGLFTIQMPSFIQTRLSSKSNDQQAGTFIGVGVMGALSALIVSACVGPAADRRAHRHRPDGRGGARWRGAVRR